MTALTEPLDIRWCATARVMLGEPAIEDGSGQAVDNVDRAKKPFMNPHLTEPARDALEKRQISL